MGSSPQKIRMERTGPAETGGTMNGKPRGIRHAEGEKAHSLDEYAIIKKSLFLRIEYRPCGGREVRKT
jgi:hypothetical protein